MPFYSYILLHNTAVAEWVSSNYDDMEGAHLYEAVEDDEQEQNDAAMSKN